MKVRVSCKRVFVVLAVAVAIGLPVLSFQFGITEDEQLHNEHGKSILDYFLGRSDAASRHPLDADGDLIFEYDEQARDLSGALNIYGGFFDLVCVATHRYLSPLGEFENRHFVNSLFGVLLIVFVGLTASRLAGWRAGVLGLLLMVLSPRIVAHSMNNPVDLPFAALYAFSLYFMLGFVEALPRPSRATWIPLLIGIPLATDVRIAGLVLIFYLVFFSCLRHVPRAFERAGMTRFIRSSAVALLVAAAVYLLVSVLWPFAHRNPLTTPLLAFRHLSRLETFNALDLFEGRWIERSEIPWYFVPKWLLIGTPLFVPLGLLLSPLAFVKRLGRAVGRVAVDRGKVAMIGFAALFPVAFVIARESNVYNDARHVLFAYPPLIVVLAVAFECLLRWRGARLPRAAFVVVLAATMLEPAHFMIRNHPNCIAYFSPLIGGVDGAWKRYETDFWGNSVRQAVEWIQEHAEPRADSPVRVRIWFGDQTKAAYYVRKKPGFEHVVVAEDSTGWDYQIFQTVECKFRQSVLKTWPPVRTVYEVLADDTPLCAVVINHRNRDPEETLEAVEAWVSRRPTHAHWLMLGSTAYMVERFEASLRAYERAAELDPEDPITWLAVGTVRGRLGSRDGQIAAYKRTLMLDPSLEFARANLQWALWQRADEAPADGEAPLTHDEYVTESLERYREGNYAASARACRLALTKDPASPIAFNNLCAAYNAMGHWEEARDACEMALALQPDYPLARGNLDHALERGR